MRTASALALCVVLTACALGGPTADAPPVAVATGTPVQAASAPRITPPTVTPPTPPGTNLPAFKCADSGGGVTGSASVTAARLAEQVGYDRFVLQFDSKVPTYTVKRQAKPVFKTGAGSQTVLLAGSAGVLVQVHSATQSGTYTGPTDFTQTAFAILNEARLVEDFEGYVSWGIGLSKTACLRTFTLSSPPRLVVDFTTS